MSCYSCRMTPCVCGASADSPSYWKDKEKEKEDYCALQRQCEELEAEGQRLRGFVQAIFEEMDWPDGGDLDAFQFQELATKHGLLEEREMEVPCGEHCACAQYHGSDENTVICYRKTPLLMGAGLRAGGEKTKPATPDTPHS